MRPALVLFSLSIVAILATAIVLAIKSHFVNQDSPLWIFTLSLNWILSLVLVACVLGAEKRLKALEENFRAIKDSQVESNYLSIRKRQVKTFAIFFISLTTLDLTALIIVLISYSSGNQNPGICFNACSKPITEKGGTYLAVKLLVEVTTPQIYLLIFWWLPKRLLVSNFHPSTV